MNTEMKDRDCPWESRDLGADEDFVGVAPAELSASVERSLGMQLVSIRLQKSLINDLKIIADHHEINYQPMIRDLLNRFAQREMRTILEMKLKALKAAAAATDEEKSVVDDFMEEERRRA